MSRGDPAAIRRILDLLLDNAVKFTDHGEVLLSGDCQAVEGNRQHLRYRVRDTGIGLSPAMLGNLFQPFEAGDSSITRRHGGLGIGLALCKRIADRLGARISVQSQPGQGSTFSLDITLDQIIKGKTELTQADLDSLAELLGQDDIRAATRFSELAQALQRHLGGERFAVLERQVVNYDYPAALRTLRGE